MKGSVLTCNNCGALFICEIVNDEIPLQCPTCIAWFPRRLRLVAEEAS